MSETERLRHLLKGIALPWEATQDRPDDEDEDEDEDAEWIACVLSHHPDTDDRDTVAVVTTGHGIEIDRAHAALIVGAVNALPALLDAADERVAELEAQLAAVTAERDALAPLVTEARRDGEYERVRRDVAEAERDEAQAGRDEALAEVERLRKENATLRSATDAAVDGVRARTSVRTIGVSCYATKPRAAGGES